MRYLVHDFPMLCHSFAVTSAYCFLLVAAQQLGKKKSNVICEGEEVGNSQLFLLEGDLRSKIPLLFWSSYCGIVAKTKLL